MHNKPSALHKRFRSFRQSFSVLFGTCVLLSSPNLFGQSKADKQWVGTWACAPYSMGTNNTNMPPAIANNTVRQIIRVSIGGDSLRVKFSNKTCATPVTMKAVNIAVSPDGTKSAITASTIKALTFGGNASVTMAAGAKVTSDAVAFALTPSMRVAITIYYGSAGNGTDLTGHVASRTNSYVLTGDQSANATFSNATTTAHWLHIIAMDVLADTSTTGAVACLGNSITDGYGLTDSPNLPGLQNRWTDAFSVKLLANPATANVGVLNLGIGGTNVTGGAETTGAKRFQEDVLNQSGVKWVIIFYGINDIIANSIAATITSAYQTMISSAHAKGMKVYCATITPFGQYKDYNTTREAVRSDVNTWIRKPGNCDGFIDFDKAMRDPSTPTQMQTALKNDWLHPNVAGYKFLGESVDLKMFELPPVNVFRKNNHNDYTVGEIYSNHINGNPMISFELPHETFVSLKVYSLLGTEIAELAGKKFSSGKHSVEFENRNLAKGMYLYTLKTDQFSASRKMIFPVH